MIVIPRLRDRVGIFLWNGLHDRRPSLTRAGWDFFASANLRTLLPLHRRPTSSSRPHSIQTSSGARQFVFRA